MTYAGLTSLIAERCSMSQESVDSVIRAFVSVAGELLVSGEDVCVSNFGRFSAHLRTYSTPVVRSSGLVSVKAVNVRFKPFRKSFILKLSGEFEKRRGVRERVLGRAKGGNEAT